MPNKLEWKEGKEEEWLDKKLEGTGWTIRDIQRACYNMLDRIRLKAFFDAKAMGDDKVDKDELLSTAMLLVYTVLERDRKRNWFRDPSVELKEWYELPCDPKKPTKPDFKALIAEVEKRTLGDKSNAQEKAAEIYERLILTNPSFTHFLARTVRKVLQQFAGPGRQKGFGKVRLKIPGGTYTHSAHEGPLAGYNIKVWEFINKYGLKFLVQAPYYDFGHFVGQVDGAEDPEAIEKAIEANGVVKDSAGHRTEKSPPIFVIPLQNSWETYSINDQHKLAIQYQNNIINAYAKCRNIKSEGENVKPRLSKDPIHHYQFVKKDKSEDGLKERRNIDRCVEWVELSWPMHSMDIHDEMSDMDSPSVYIKHKITATPDEIVAREEELRQILQMAAKKYNWDDIDMHLVKTLYSLDEATARGRYFPKAQQTEVVWYSPQIRSNFLSDVAGHKPSIDYIEKQLETKITSPFLQSYVDKDLGIIFTQNPQYRGEIPKKKEEIGITDTQIENNIMDKLRSVRGKDLNLKIRERFELPPDAWKDILYHVRKTLVPEVRKRMENAVSGQENASMIRQDKGDMNWNEALQAEIPKNALTDDKIDLNYFIAHASDFEGTTQAQELQRLVSEFASRTDEHKIEAQRQLESFISRERTRRG